jgi:hypothetical protein
MHIRWNVEQWDVNIFIETYEKENIVIFMRNITITIDTSQNDSKKQCFNKNYLKARNMIKKIVILSGIALACSAMHMDYQPKPRRLYEIEVHSFNQIESIDRDTPVIQNFLKNEIVDLGYINGKLVIRRNNDAFLLLYPSATFEKLALDQGKQIVNSNAPNCEYQPMHGYVAMISDKLAKNVHITDRWNDTFLDVLNAEKTPQRAWARFAPLFMKGLVQPMLEAHISHIVITGSSEVLQARQRGEAIDDTRFCSIEGVLQ